MTDADALTIKAGHDGRICALTLSGALDLTTAAGFLEHVAQVVDDRTERFVLDLAGLAFLDCTGARALAMATDTAPSGCPVIIRSISPFAARLIELLGLDLRHLWQEPSAGLEDPGTPVRLAQPAAPTARSGLTLRLRASRNLWRAKSRDASHRHAR
jgi:anti-anti-sigma factor